MKKTTTRRAGILLAFLTCISLLSTKARAQSSCSTVIGFSSKTTCAGQKVSLSHTSSSGTVSSVEWYANNVLISKSMGSAADSPTTTTLYRVVVKFNGGCVAEDTGTIRVTPLPVGTNSTGNQTICSGSSIATINLGTTKSLSGTTFSWKRDNTSAVTGIAASGSGNTISGFLYNTTGTDQKVVFTISPAYNGCQGADYTVVVTVRPTPVAVPSKIKQTICSGEAMATVNMTTSPSVNNAVFSWSRDNKTAVSFSGGTSGVGTVIAGNLVNNTDLIQTVTFSVMPVNTGTPTCYGKDTTFTVIVEPKPILGIFHAGKKQTICSGKAIVPVKFASNLNNVTFNWTRDKISEVTGLPEYGDGDSIPSAVLVNKSGFPQKVTIIVTVTGPHTRLCESTPDTVEITVEPTPEVASSRESQSICSGESITTMYLSTANNISGSTFKWTRDNTTNVSGTVGVSGSNPSISGTLVNNTDTPQLVIFTVTAFSPFSQGCHGPEIKIPVMVDPRPIAQVNYTLDTICSGENIERISFAVKNNIPNTTYSWTRTRTTEVGGLAASGTGTSISGKLINNTGVSQAVEFTVKPIGPGSNKCHGTVAKVTIIVEPVPVIISDITTQSVCSGEALADFGFSTQNNMSGIIFRWSRDNSSVGGMAASGTGAIRGSLVNHSDSIQLVNFAVKADGPHAKTCAGAEYKVRVLVYPRPEAVASVPSQSVCSGYPMETISLSTGNAIPSAYSWTRSHSSVVTGMPESGSGDEISGTLVNPTIEPQKVIFTIWPQGADAQRCQGDSITAEVTVNPMPEQPRIITKPSGPVCRNTRGVNFGIAPIKDEVSWSTGDPYLGIYGIHSQNVAIDFPYSPTTLRVKVTARNKYGCSRADSVDVSVTSDLAPNPGLVILYGSNTLVCLDNMTTRYQWGYDTRDSLKSVELHGEINKEVHVDPLDTAHKYYWVRTGGSGDCSTKSYFNRPQKTLSVDEQTLQSDKLNLQAMPNPNAGSFRLNLNHPVIGGCQAVITDLAGRYVSEYKWSDTAAELQVSGLKPGMYFVRISGAGVRAEAVKVVVQ